MNTKIISELKEKAKTIHGSNEPLKDKYSKLHVIAHNAENQGVANAWDLIIEVICE